MPLAACEKCGHRFIVEDERSPQRICPRCLRPLRIVSSAEALPRGGPAVSGSNNGPDPAGVWFGDQPLASDRVGWQMLQVVAEAAYLRDRAKELRQAAQSLRRELASLPASDGPAFVRSTLPTRIPPQAGDAVSAEELTTNRERARTLCEWASTLREQVRTTYPEAGLARDKARQVREQVHSALPAPGQAALPSSPEPAR